MILCLDQTAIKDNDAIVSGDTWKSLSDTRTLEAGTL